MTVSKSIFVDLDIDTELMVSNPEEFSAQVYKAADKLMNILDENTSLSDARKKSREKAKANKEAIPVAKQMFSFDEMIAFAEEGDPDVLFHFIERVKSLTKELELIYEDRATSEMIMNSADATTKRLAHAQYSRLREAFDSYRNFVTMIVDEDLVLIPLKAKTGNYGGGKFEYPSYKLNGNSYFNYHAVARLVGIDMTGIESNADFQEKLLPEHGVEIVMITL